MWIHVTSPEGLFIGSRVYNRGERVEVADVTGRRHVKAGTAVIALDLPGVEFADADGPDETAGSPPRRHRKV